MTSEIAKIVFLDRGTFPPETWVRAPSFPHKLIYYDHTAPDQVAERIADADVIVTNKVAIGSAGLKGAKRLRSIAIAATGYDVIDLKACGERGIAVSNIRNYAANTVPEHTFALMLALRRSVLPYHGSVENGRWQASGQFCYFDFPINNLAGSTLGIIGDGVIGQAVAKIGQAFGMRTLFAAYKGANGMGPLYTPFPEVLEASDVITIHSPLLPSTRNMIGQAEFNLMKRRPLIINTARGGLVDESALTVALETGQIAGAGFDVVTVEPPPIDHPFMRLVGRPDFILTPHVAWSSREAIQTLADQLIDNIEGFWSGAPRNTLV